MIYYLYRIINSITLCQYIGITNNTNKRFSEHRNNSHNKYLRASIGLHGIDSFQFIVETEGTRDFISDLEISEISKARKIGMPLYNIANGGLIGNGMPGKDHWNAQLTEDDVIHIRLSYSTNLCTQRKLADIYNISYKQISKIVRGTRWAHIGGPITLNKQEISKVANKRKLTDIQVEQLRNEAQDEFNLFGKIDIVEIANLMGIARQSMRKILIGEVYKTIRGPLLGKDYFIEYGKGKNICQ